MIGLTKAKGDQGWFDPDDQVIVPYRTAMKRLFGLDYVREIDIQGKSGADQAQVQSDITQVLRRRHRIEPGRRTISTSATRRRFWRPHRLSARHLRFCWALSAAYRCWSAGLAS